VRYYKYDTARCQSKIRRSKGHSDRYRSALISCSTASLPPPPMNCFLMTPCLSIRYVAGIKRTIYFADTSSVPRSTV